MLFCCDLAHPCGKQATPYIPLPIFLSQRGLPPLHQSLPKPASVDFSRLLQWAREVTPWRLWPSSPSPKALNFEFKAHSRNPPIL